MTNQQINIAIAKACGLTIVSDGIMHHLTPCGKKTEHNPEGCLLKECPDYCNDLNAMHEAEKTLTKEQVRVYSDFLAYSPHESCWASCTIWHQTSRQRAEAFMKTIGKWESVK
jgi:hypothetical protein